MLDFISTYWLWILLIGGMFFMHRGRHGHGGGSGGCGGGHSGHTGAGQSRGDHAGHEHGGPEHRTAGGKDVTTLYADGVDRETGRGAQSQETHPSRPGGAR